MRKSIAATPLLGLFCLLAEADVTFPTAFGPIQVNANGGLTLPAPSSGNALLLNGAASSYVLRTVSPNTTGVSLGPQFVAGTNTSDIALDIVNAAQSTHYFLVRGDGQSTFSGNVLLPGVQSSGTTFTLGTGTGACTATSTLTGGASAGSFLCTGTAGASTIVINLPTAAHGWTCSGGDITSGVAWAQVTPIATNSCKLTGTLTTTSDQVNFKSEGY